MRRAKKGIIYGETTRDGEKTPIGIGTGYTKDGKLAWWCYLFIPIAFLLIWGWMGIWFICYPYHKGRWPLVFGPPA